MGGLGMVVMVSLCYKGQYSTLDLSYKDFLMSIIRFLGKMSQD